MAFLTGEEARGMARVMTERAAADPDFAEDLESLLEPKDFIVIRRDAGWTVRCECCGTLVALTPEVSVYDRESRPETAIWEPATVRKHTLRRCNYWRGLTLARPGP